MTTGFAPVVILVILNIRISRGINSLNRKRQVSTRRCCEPATSGQPKMLEKRKSVTNQRHYKEIR